jgi:hypothetical protein
MHATMQNKKDKHRTKIENYSVAITFLHALLIGFEQQ